MQSNDCQHGDIAGKDLQDPCRGVKDDKSPKHETGSALVHFNLAGRFVHHEPLEFSGIGDPPSPTKTNAPQ